MVRRIIQILHFVVITMALTILSNGIFLSEAQAEANAIWSYEGIVYKNSTRPLDMVNNRYAIYSYTNPMRFSICANDGTILQNSGTNPGIFHPLVDLNRLDIYIRNNTSGGLSTTEDNFILCSAPKYGQVDFNNAWEFQSIIYATSARDLDTVNYRYAIYSYTNPMRYEICQDGTKLQSTGDSGINPGIFYPLQDFNRQGLYIRNTNPVGISSPVHNYTLWRRPKIITNAPPVFNRIGNWSIDLGDTLNLKVNATDADYNSVLTYSASGLPEGANFDPASRTLTWTPTSAQLGNYQVHFEVSDGELTDSEDITILVTNYETVIAQFEAKYFWTGSETLSYYMVINPSGNECPDYNAHPGEVWRCTTHISNSYKILGGIDYSKYYYKITCLSAGLRDIGARVYVQEGPAYGETILRPGEAKIIDSPGNVQTFITIASQAGPDNTAIFSLKRLLKQTPPPVLTVPADITVEATGVATPAGIGQASATGSSAITIVNDAPKAFPLGITVVTWTATDASGNKVTGTQKVTVEDTTKPVINLPADINLKATALQNQVEIGSATATDAFPVTLTNDAPALFPIGATRVTWTATDVNGNVSTGMQTITFRDEMPVLSISGSRNGEEGQAISLLASTSDADDAVVALRADGLPSGAVFDPASGSFTWTPGFAQAGSYEISFTASDGVLTVSETVTLSVANVTVNDIAQRLSSHLASLKLVKGLGNSLNAKLEAALKSLEKGHKDAAVNQFSALINEVEAQRGKALTIMDADIMLNCARLAIAAIEQG